MIVVKFLDDNDNMKFNFLNISEEELEMFERALYNHEIGCASDIPFEISKKIETCKKEKTI